MVDLSNNKNQNSTDSSKFGQLPGLNAENPIDTTNFPPSLLRLQTKIADWNDQVTNEGWKVELPDTTEARPALTAGLNALQDSASIIVGMSLENSYFSAQTVDRLCQFLGNINSKVYFVIMDQPAEHNYRALGYTEKKTQQKISYRTNRLRRFINQSLDRLGDSAQNFSVVDWSLIYESPIFKEALTYMQHLYDTDSFFQHDVESTASHVLSTRLGDGDKIEQEAIKEASQYLIEELAFLSVSNQILNQEQLVYLYHRAWPVFENLVSEKYGDFSIPDLSFAELTIQDRVVG